MNLKDIDLLDADRFVRMEHHEMFTVLREKAPLFWHDHPDGFGFWNVVKHADVRHVNRDNELFSSEAGGISIENYDEQPDNGAHVDQRGLNMLYTDPPKHTRYRRLVNKGFTPRMVGLLEQFLAHRTTLIVDNVIERGEADFVGDLAAELPLQAIAEIMGVPQEDRHLLFKWSNDLIGIDDPEYKGDPLVAAMELYSYTHELAAQRGVDPQDDIITKLINAEIEGDRLTEIELDLFMMLLAVAGNETTRNATSHGMYALLTHPEQLALLQSDIDTYIDSAVDEIIRWASPVLHFRRTTTAPTELLGTEIQKGSRVVMWYISANRDEEVFDDPFSFDITRSPNDHIAFGGGGAHYCLGANLARAELRLIFREIIERIPDMRLAGEPDYLRSNFIGGIKRLPVVWTPGSKVNPS
jgi:cholest-4-en-3-one 26-monooxygenase